MQRPARPRMGRSPSNWPLHRSTETTRSSSPRGAPLDPPSAGRQQPHHLPAILPSCSTCDLHQLSAQRLVRSRRTALFDRRRRARQSPRELPRRRHPVPMMTGLRQSPQGRLLSVQVPPLSSFQSQMWIRQPATRRVQVPPIRTASTRKRQSLAAAARVPVREPRRCSVFDHAMHR